MDRAELVEEAQKILGLREGMIGGNLLAELFAPDGAELFDVSGGKDGLHPSMIAGKRIIVRGKGAAGIKEESPKGPCTASRCAPTAPR